MYGFYRIAAIVPRLKVADVRFNADEILRCVRIAEQENASLALFPELSLTGYTCGDLFHQKTLLDGAAAQLRRIARALTDSDMLVVVGLPVLVAGKLYNCAASIHRGRVITVTPKRVLPNQREFYEARHFSSGNDLLDSPVPLAWKNGEETSDSARITDRFSCGNGVFAGIELCEDLWSPMPPSSHLAAHGCNLILNLSASNALVSKSQYRRSLVVNQSARCMAVYAYASAGVHESTTDTVYGGHALIAENGVLLAENSRFERDSSFLYAEVDLARLTAQRLSEGAFRDFPAAAFLSGAVPEIVLREVDSLRYRAVNPHPFVPSESASLDEVCGEIFHIQCAGLAKRLEVTAAKTSVIGISGGLDSTLALLVAVETCRLLSRDPATITAITMPGFGTTRRTRGNALKLSERMGVSCREISIVESCRIHFRDIGQEESVRDVTYENVQARERTQILMDTANREGGLVIGTGDLSEIALGWSTYNADHMSMYAVNCGVPKTLVRHIVRWYADKEGGLLGDVLHDILATPVSPELLPTDDSDEILQKTEQILGPYELHDFYLYHFVKYGAPPEKLLFLARAAFSDRYSPAERVAALRVFLHRFFTQQFKRSCIPDGPKVGVIALSPRADWRMPSDAECALWLASLDAVDSDAAGAGSKTARAGKNSVSSKKLLVKRKADRHG